MLIVLHLCVLFDLAVFVVLLSRNVLSVGMLRGVGTGRSGMRSLAGRAAASVVVVVLGFLRGSLVVALGLVFWVVGLAV